MQFPDFSFEELERRATRFLRDPYWAERGVDLKRFAAQWVPLGNAGRTVDPSKNGTATPSEEGLAWCRRALKDADPVNQEEARKSLARWGLTESELFGRSA